MVSHVHSTSQQTIVYLNGKFIPKNKACISPDDRGFYFADGVYEVIKFYGGKSFCFGDHMRRLQKSLIEIRIKNAETDNFETICHKLIEINNLEDTYAVIYLQFTRGSHVRMHGFPEPEVSPTVYATAIPMPVRLKEMKNGIKVISQEDIRWLRCDIKSIALLANTLSYQKALDCNALECFYIRDGVFTEATHSNIMAIRNGMLYTHPDSYHILSGITKKVVIGLCNNLGIGIKEQPIEVSRIREYDEFFITGTGNEIMPVTMIDDIVINNGAAGTFTRKLQNAFFNITYGELAGENIQV